MFCDRTGNALNLVVKWIGVGDPSVEAFPHICIGTWLDDKTETKHDSQSLSIEAAVW